MPNNLKSIIGRKLGLDYKGRLVSDGRLLTGSVRDPMSLIMDKDDFLGDLITDEWGIAKGSDAACVDFAISAAVGGMVRATTGAGAGASMAANGVQLHKQLNWKAAQGSLALSARVKLSAITTIACFVGFTDQIAALEMPINAAGSANTITTTATDAVGLMFDTSMSTANWWGVGVANDVDATAANSGVAPAAATYQRLRVELDLNGGALFYINEALVGAATLAVTPSVSLTPVVACFRRAASSATIDVDYIAVEGERV